MNSQLQMTLELKRIFKGENYTIGRLFIDGEYFCDTLEDPVRQLDSIKDKIYSETAIPAGKYKVSMSIVSPKYSIRKSYNWCGGRLPRLIDVPFFEGILIHSGNTPDHTAGCILVGENKIKGQVINSMNTLKNLWVKLNVADEVGEEIWIDIS